MGWSEGEVGWSGGGVGVGFRSGGREMWHKTTNRVGGGRAKREEEEIDFTIISLFNKNRKHATAFLFLLLFFSCLSCFFFSFFKFFYLFFFIFFHFFIWLYFVG